MEVIIPPEAIKQEIKKAVVELDLIPRSSTLGHTITLDDFRKKYCGGRSKAWVKEEIFYKFKPDWVDDIHPGRGRKITIFEYPAAEWMNEHRKEINWRSKNE
ncbi:MAG: hypothetical protein K5983_00465 [Lactobacillus sp.]|nr:hypothetical protein [Lactobacillus sp.]